MDSERVRREIGDLVEAEEELSAELDGTREELDLLQLYSTRLLETVGISKQKAGFIYLVLDLEDDPRVKSVTLHKSCKLGVLAAEVYLTRQFRNINAVRAYLAERGLQGGELDREGVTYRLQRQDLGVTVYFSVKK